MPRVIGQTEQTRDAKSSARPPSRSQAASRQEFIDQLRADRREVALAVLRAAEASGFVATEYRSSSAKVWARITLPDVSGIPVTLDQDFLWVSLGRHHPALREPAVNQEIRQAIRRVAPALRQAENPNKSEVGIPLESIGLGGLAHLQGLFAIVKRGLVQSESAERQVGPTDEPGSG